MPFKRVPRLASFNYTGCYRYFLTICAAGRARLFVTDEAVSLVLLELSRTSADEHFAVTAYCFMPDHVHVLIEGTRDDWVFVPLEAKNDWGTLAAKLLRACAAR